MVTLMSCGALLQALLVSGMAWATQEAGPAARAASGAAAAALTVPAPSEKAEVQEEPPAQEPQEFRLHPEPGSLPIIDFRWLEIQPSLGVGVFSDDFRIDPSPYISLLVRAPIPWLSPDSDPVGEYLGVFAEATVFPQADRKIEPELENPSGSFLFFALGLDFTILRDETVLLMVRGGALYGWYGGITNLDDGFASLAGLTAGIQLGKGLTITASPDVIFAHAGDMIYRGSLGLLIEF